MKKYILCLSTIMNMNAMQIDIQHALTKALDLVDRFPANAEQYLDNINKQGVPLKAAGDAGSVVLHAAVRKGCSLFIEKCVEAGANINVKDPLGRTPLHEACCYFDMDIAAVSCYNNGFVCRPEMVDLILKFDATKVKITDKDGRTPLHVVVGCPESREKVENIVEMLIHAGVNMECKDVDEKTAYDYACDDLKKILLRDPDHYDCKIDLENPPIYSLKNHPELLKKAIPLGLNVNACDSYNGASLLWLFCDSVDPEKRELTEEVVDLLIRYGVDINHKNEYGNTILHKIALTENFPESLTKKFIDAGADINAQNNRRESPLHWASSSWYLNNLIINIAMARLLLEHGKANINIQDEHGNTPLHNVVACSQRDAAKQKQMVSLLLFHGADCETRNFLGSTPYNLACCIASNVTNMLKNKDAVFQAISGSEFFWQ